MHLIILAFLIEVIFSKIFSTGIGARDEILQMRCQPVKRMQVSVLKLNVWQWLTSFSQSFDLFYILIVYSSRKLDDRNIYLIFVQYNS